MYCKSGNTVIDFTHTGLKPDNVPPLLLNYFKVKKAAHMPGQENSQNL
jgi:hypothetical protein